MSSTSPQGIYAAFIVLPVLSIGAVGLRLYARRRQAHTLSSDDWMQIPNLFLTIALGVVGLIGVAHHAVGQEWPLNHAVFYPEFVLYAKLEFIMLMITAILLATIKISALLFFRRIFRLQHGGWLARIVVALVALEVLWSVVFITWNALACGVHPQLRWEGPLGGPNYAKHCVPAQTTYNSAFAASDWILDLTVLIVPLPPIWRLHMAVKKKLAVSFVFMLALIGFAASTARLVAWLQEDQIMRNPNRKNIQRDGLRSTQGFWFAMLEAGCTLVSVNLPPVWGFVSQLVPGWLRACRRWRSPPSSDSSQYVEHQSHGHVEETKSTSRVQQQEQNDSQELEQAREDIS